MQCEYYCSVALPFGWSLAPEFFTKFMHPVVAALRMPVLLCLPTAWPFTQLAGVTCRINLDDLLLLLLCNEYYSSVVAAVLDLYTSLELLFKNRESVLVLSAVVCHLGFYVDALNHRIILPDNKHLSIASHCCQLLS